MPYKRTKERTFITLPTGAEVLTQAFSPARCLRGDRRQRSVLFKAEGRHYLAKNVSGLMLVSPSAPVGRVIRVRSLVRLYGKLTCHTTPPKWGAQYRRARVQFWEAKKKNMFHMVNYEGVVYFYISILIFKNILTHASRASQKRPWSILKPASHPPCSSTYPIMFPTSSPPFSPPSSPPDPAGPAAGPTGRGDDAGGEGGTGRGLAPLLP